MRRGRSILRGLIPGLAGLQALFYIVVGIDLLSGSSGPLGRSIAEGVIALTAIPSRCASCRR